VHLNAAFVEPLIGEAAQLPQGRPERAPWRSFSATTVTASMLDLTSRRVLAVVGQGVAPDVIAHCTALDWVVLGDATAQGTLAYFDPLLRDDEFTRSVRPDVIVRIGGLPASKVLGERMKGWATRTIALRGAGPVADPDGLVGEYFDGLPSADDASLRADASYAKLWRTASDSVGQYLQSRESDEDALDEPMVAGIVVESSGDLGVPLVVGSSMPVRDVEWWAATRRSPTFANRGANGIDGVVSTVFGVSASQKGIGLVGDLTLLHDVSGLVEGLGDAKGSCALVVSDNRGGGIFSFLPQASEVASDRFNQLFATPREHNIESIARAFGHQGVTVETRGELRRAIVEGLSAPGVTVIVAKVPDREENVRRHEALNRDVMTRRDRA
jgi:2-succinyl-5-enolpyruvyl-6-hydroxy-3-cyclohexene-1-carboxylate synthase